jgi:hypothetical protein
LLLKGQPDNLTDATDQATKIEFALEFGDDKAPATETTEVFTVKQPTPSQGVSERSDKLEQLEWKLDEMAKRFEKLETQWDRGSGAGRFSGGRRPPPRNARCFRCNKLRHFKKQCPLNSRAPARGVTGSWRED